MVKRKFFGTDGIRGNANTAPMDAETAMLVGMAAGIRFVRGDHRHRVVIGKDTRLSGYLIEPALTAGFISVGMDVVLVGPMPSPAVSLLTRSLRADLGVMISASHNPYYDNGIKLFGPDGYKLSDQIELEIEGLMTSDMTKYHAKSDKLGRAKRLDDTRGRYIEYVKNRFPKGKTLDGYKIVIDCANGAAYNLGPTILQELGADVIPIGVSPNGFNINASCGATDPKIMCDAVRQHGADLGIALDGDADRLIMSDENGKIYDGDQLLAVIATDWHDKGMLKRDTIVSTVMSNLGLELYLREIGINLVRTPVGDRYVIEMMRSQNLNVGGEASGHIVLSDYTTTGDALIAALQVLSAIESQKKKASKVLNCFMPLPQIMRNVKFSKGMDPLDNKKVKLVIEESEKELGRNGRLVIRRSGTEPVIRVMAEGKEQKLIKKVVDNISYELERVAQSDR